MKHLTAIVDYGVGNLQSVTNAMSYVGLDTIITGDPQILRRADSIILPGVGAFPDAATRLQESGLGALLISQAAEKPILGICLGMQLLFEEGDEGRLCAGLGLIPGRVQRIETQFKLPHIGWNSLSFQHSCPLFRGLQEDAYVYFVHSFCGVATEEAHVTARTEYGSSVVAAVAHGTVFGCQFHPEKSGEAGLLMLKNFGELSR